MAPALVAVPPTASSQWKLQSLPRDKQSQELKEHPSLSPRLIFLFFVKKLQNIFCGFCEKSFGVTFQLDPAQISTS